MLMHHFTGGAPEWRPACHHGGGAVTAKIIDLGLAKSLDEPGAQTAISTPGAFAGRFN